MVLVEDEDDGDDEDDDDGDQHHHRDQHVLTLTGAEADPVSRLGTVTTGDVWRMIVNLITDIILNVIINLIVQHSSGNIHTVDWGVSAISDSNLCLTQHLLLLLLLSEVSDVKI